MESVAVTALDLELAQREREGSPVRVGLVGAGAMGQVIALQLSGGVCGMRLAAVASRAPARAEQVLQAAGVRAAVTDDVGRLCGAPEIDVLIEASGDVEYGAQVATQAPFTQTAQVPAAAASSQSRKTSSRVASALSSV